MGLEDKLLSGVLPTTAEKLVGYTRKNSVWPAIFGLACCATELFQAWGARLWRLPLRPGESRSLGCSAPQNLAETPAILKPMPLDAWMAVQTAPRTPCQIDHPGLAAS